MKNSVKKYGAEVSKQVKQELATKFQGVKFSVRYSSYSGGDSIRVSWTFGPTVKEVEAITELYQGGHFNGMTDSYEYKEENDTFINAAGELEERGSVKFVFTEREISDEFLNEIAAEYCKRHDIEYEAKPMQAVCRKHGFNRYVSEEVYKMVGRASFKTLSPVFAGIVLVNHDYEIAFTETVNGETVGLTEKDLKIKALEDKVKDLEEWRSEETKQKNEYSTLYYNLLREVEEEKKKRLQPFLINTEEKRLFVTDGKYANLNKNETLAQYHEEVLKGDFRTEETKITEILCVNDETYEFLKDNLLTDLDFLAGKGGSNSRYQLPEQFKDVKFWELPGLEQEKFRAQVYRLGLLVYHPTKELFIIDPQGHKYARYVATLNTATQQELREYVESKLL